MPLVETRPIHLDMGVAQIVFSIDERRRIDEIVEELDPAGHELTRRFRERLSEPEWHWVVAYLRREIRAVLEIGSMLRAVTEQSEHRGLADPNAVQHLLKNSRTRNFGLSDNSDDHFNAICSKCDPPSDENYEPPLWKAGDALLELAQDRLFGTFDEEYAELLDSLGA